jgi:hypothetical protein
VPEKLTVSPENADRFRDWLQNRGGLAIWRSVNLSNPGASWTTPALQPDGSPTPKPTWEADSHPERIVTDPAEVEVVEPREVRRFHVAVRRGSQGFTLKLTDASTRKVRAAVEKAGDEAWYVFDYSTQEAVILVPGETRPL